MELVYDLSAILQALVFIDPSRNKVIIITIAL